MMLPQTKHILVHLFAGLSLTFLANTIVVGEINYPDEVVFYEDTFAGFPDIISLQNGDLLMVAREGRWHLIDQEQGRVNRYDFQRWRSQLGRSHGAHRHSQHR